MKWEWEGKSNYAQKVLASTVTMTIIKCTEQDIKGTTLHIQCVNLMCTLVVKSTEVLEGGKVWLSQNVRCSFSQVS